MSLAVFWAIVLSGWALMVADARFGIAGGNGGEVSCWMTVAADVILAVIRAIEGEWAITGIYVAAAIICGWFAWHAGRRRRQRKNALASLGAKSRALRDALVRRARHAARPSPVLRPSLRGA